MSSSDNLASTKFEVFLSYSDSAGGHEFAKVVFDELVSRGINVFFAKASLPDTPGGSDYYATINKVLEFVPIFLTVASDEGQFETKWVKYERETFLASRVLESECPAMIISYISGMDRKSIPFELKRYQALVHEENGIEPLYQFIATHLNRNESRKMVAVAEATVDSIEKTNRAMGSVVLAEGRVIQQLVDAMGGALGPMLGIDLSEYDKLRDAIDDLDRILREKRHI